MRLFPGNQVYFYDIINERKIKLWRKFNLARLCADFSKDDANAQITAVYSLAWELSL